ncbi:MAG: hypothetical protein ACI9FB_002724, partial [Candidatus Azotimanducaceae bacterium]
SISLRTNNSSFPILILQLSPKNAQFMALIFGPINFSKLDEDFTLKIQCLQAFRSQS